MKGVIVDFMEKARIKMEHWARHNEDHLQEYTSFADKLASTGKDEAVLHIREMVTLIDQSNQCLRKALQTLDQP